MKLIRDAMTGETKEKGVTTLDSTGQSAVDAGIVSASSYSQKVKARQQALREAKQHGKPLGGAPPIPEGKLAPIAEAARAAQQSMNMPKPFWAPPDQVPSPEQFVPPPAPQRPTRPPMSPDQAVNQAIASGKFDQPVSLAEAKRQVANQTAQSHTGAPGKISDETRFLLSEQQKQQAAMQQPQSAAQPEQNMPSRKEALDGAEKEIVDTARQEENFPIFDFGPVSEVQRKMMGPERRKQIESRLSPLNFIDLIQRGDVNQIIPVIPGQFELTLRTISQRENLFCMQYIYEHTGSAEYTTQLFNTCRLACSVVAINGGMLPDHRIQVGRPDEEVDRKAFENKLGIILRMPTVVLADMGIQYDWFNERIASLFTVEKLKNG